MKKTILAASLLASFGSSHAVDLYSNGPVVDSSSLSIIRVGGSLLGIGGQSSVPNIVADDFTVAGAPWNVERLSLFSYQSFSEITYTFTSATWSVVSGDVNTGTVVASGTAVPVANGGLVGYRVSATTLTNQDRAIYRIEVDVPDFSLPAGSYWLRWALAGSLASGPWISPTADGVIGNAVQSVTNGAYAPAVDAGDGLGIELPFVIDGTTDGIFADGFDTLPPN